MTTAEMIHNFISWAEMRLQKELELCERVESEFGSEELTFKPQKLSGLTDEDRLDILHEVDHLLSHGYSVREASKECGIHNTTYYRWKRELNEEHRETANKN
jgi:DNA invertase Pin-like site-specific DNA recombinase